MYSKHFLNLNTPGMKSIEISNDPADTRIYRPVMAGVMAGIIATLLNLIYDQTYRSSTGFSLSPLINVASIIFGTMLVLSIIGFLYALMDQYRQMVCRPSYNCLCRSYHPLHLAGLSYTSLRQSRFNSSVQGIIIGHRDHIGFLRFYFDSTVYKN